MKSFTLLFIFFVVLGLAFEGKSESTLKESQWRLERTNFYFENDFFLKTDDQYTAGWKFSNVYYVPNSDGLEPSFFFDVNRTTFISFGIAEQIYTPDDINESKLIPNDRPYAGWFYLEVGLHQSSQKELNSFVVQLGIVGKYSGAETIQKNLHKILGSEAPKGWNNQLHNELGINLIYQHKWRFEPDEFLGMDSNIIPFLGASLGNVETDINSGVLMRFGWNHIKDFGASSINIGGENGIPVRTNCLCSQYKTWSFTFNLSASVQAVAHNIFLDGNTFAESHSVQKEHYLAYGSYGFTLKYKHFSLDYTLSSHSKEYKTEKNRHNYASLIFAYLY